MSSDATSRPMSPRSASPVPEGGATPLRALRTAEAELEAARRAAATATAHVQACEKRAADAHALLNAAKQSALLSARPRRLSTAFLLWLLTPLVWPGGYLFYLGRDAHALLYTVSFGGFGVGWLLDLFFLPLYVADHNEPAGYLDRVQGRGWLASLGGVLLAPFTLALQVLLAVYVGAVAAYLVPRPLVLPTALAAAPLSRAQSASVAFCVGMLAVAACVRLSSTRVGRARAACRWRPVLAWSTLCSAVLAPTSLQFASSESPTAEELGHVPGLLFGAIGVLVGARAGRRLALERTPRARTSRRLGPRLLGQLVGVALFGAAALGSFYLNGTYTYTDAAKGPTTVSGPEALRLAYDGLGDFSRDLRSALSTLYARQQAKTWEQMWGELREALRDPAVEAAALLGVSADASAEEVKRAHRQLARLHHPDKAPPEKQEEAKLLMQRLNWAKEVLVGK